SAAAEAAASLDGVAKVRLADDPVLEHGLAETVARLIISLMGDVDTLLAPATTYGKNILPRVAALADVQQISEITAVEAANRFVRPIYAGNALATVETGQRKNVITVRTTAFDAVGPASTPATVEAVTVPGDLAGGQSRFVERQETVSERPDLTAARVVISGGRGMGSAENFGLIEPIADALGAAMGASRAAVDAGYVSNDWQVGQTGKVVAPELYIAIGISGAIQHLAGMKDSKVIVAINKDEEAPIFQIADYGLVADLFDVLPQLAAALEGTG
ncbi:MAG: FAD-binding protein, partial [Alphaproteobacteria bacterium]|nr:FAD-binding protein [Alphaproteobacteria bacterium]